jgi:hypothetical protein
MCSYARPPFLPRKRSGAVSKPGHPDRRPESAGTVGVGGQRPKQRERLDQPDGRTASENSLHRKVVRAQALEPVEPDQALPGV